MPTLSARDILGIKIIAASAAILIVLLALVAWRYAGKIQIDPETLCPKALPFAKTVILIDKTDPFTEKQQDELRAFLTTLAESLETFEQLSIFKLEDASSLGRRPVFSLCNPGRKAQPLYENPALVEKRYREKFGNLLKELIPSLAIGQTADTSPILEAIQKVSRSREFDGSATQRKLIIYSDLLQNVRELSFYSKTIKTYEDYKGSAYRASTEADLNRARVSIYRIPRPGFQAAQNQHLIKFWRDYFEDSGASAVEIKDLP